MFTGIVAGTAEITRIIEKKEIKSFSIALVPYLE